MSGETYEIPKWNSCPIDFDSEKGKWFHWDEVWAFPIGFWDTREEAEENLKKYGYYLDHGDLSGYTFPYLTQQMMTPFNHNKRNQAMSKEIHENTNIAGCSIMIRKNHVGKWCVYPLMKIEEMCDGLNTDECVDLAASLHRASERVAEMNDRSNTMYLFDDIYG